MGMYDDFQFLGDDANLVRCAAGHPQTSTQTKDLDCMMTHYMVNDKHLYEADRSEPKQITEVRAEGLSVTKSWVYPFVTLTREVTVYTHCEECSPVVYESSQAGLWRDGVMTVQPWCEWVLVFREGILTEVRPERVETRDDIRKKLAEAGSSALPDDDRVARRTIERWRDKKEVLPLFLGLLFGGTGLEQFDDSSS